MIVAIGKRQRRDGNSDWHVSRRAIAWCMIDDGPPAPFSLHIFRSFAPRRNCPCPRCGFLSPSSSNARTLNEPLGERTLGAHRRHSAGRSADGRRAPARRRPSRSATRRRARDGASTAMRSSSILRSGGLLPESRRAGPEGFRDVAHDRGRRRPAGVSSDRHCELQRGGEDARRRRACRRRAVAGRNPRLDGAVRCRTLQTRTQEERCDATILSSTEPFVASAAGAVDTQLTYTLTRTCP